MHWKKSNSTTPIAKTFNISHSLIYPVVRATQFLRLSSMTTFQQGNPHSATTFTFQSDLLYCNLMYISSFRNLPSRLPSNVYARIHYFRLTNTSWRVSNQTVSLQPWLFLIDFFQNHRISSSPVVTNNPQATHLQRSACLLQVIHTQPTIGSSLRQSFKIFTNFRNAAFLTPAPFQTILFLATRQTSFLSGRILISQSRSEDSPMRGSIQRCTIMH